MLNIPVFQSFQNEKMISFLRERKILQGQETVQDLFVRVISALVDVERTFNTKEEKIESLKNKLLLACDQRMIALGAPILLNAGNENRSLSSCTVIPIDLRNDLQSLKSSIFPYYAKDMGSGFNLNDVDDPKRTLQTLNQILLEITPFVKRPPCGMAMLNINHPKIEEFILAKKEADFNNWRFNLSVGITKQFMDAVKTKGQFTLKNGSSIDAEKLFFLMTDTAHYCGEPGMVFLDAINQENPVPSMECKTVVPCAEMALSDGEVCQFSYLNISKMVQITPNGKEFDFSTLEKTTNLLTRVLDNAIEISIKNAISSPEIIASKRRIALGICGAADLFLDLKLPYDSSQSCSLLSDIMATIQVTSKEMSVRLAKKRGPFPLFDQSRYKEKGFASRFIKNNNSSRILQSRWESLEEKILTYGLRNSGTTALPPTGISAIIVNASASIEPLFSLKNRQGEMIPELKVALNAYFDQIDLDKKKREKVLEQIQEVGFISEKIQEIPQKIKNLFKVGKQIDWQSQLNMVLAVQKFNDESVSKTVNCSNATTPDEIAKIFLHSYDLGLKGITVFRDGCLEERKRSF